MAKKETKDLSKMLVKVTRTNKDVVQPMIEFSKGGWTKCDFCTSGTLMDDVTCKYRIEHVEWMEIKRPVCKECDEFMEKYSFEDE